MSAAAAGEGAVAAAAAAASAAGEEAFASFVAAPGREAKAFVSESSAATGATAAADAVDAFSTAAGAAGTAAAAAGATGTVSPPLLTPPPPRPSGVGEVSELAPLLLFPAAPGFRRPMKEEVASGEVEVVVVSSWERTRDAARRRERERGLGERVAV